MREYERVRVAIIRGGTSKGVYIMGNELPQDPGLRDRVILNIFGSPDIRQINGLGGADPLTSKCAIINPSQRDDADVDYTFAYVGVEKGTVDYAGNCGNISSGVGPFAVDEGLVKAAEPVTVVRIFNTNTNKVIEAEVPVRDGKALTEGDLAIDGVPGTGAKILLNFLNSGGSKTGKLLPTGNAVDQVKLKDGQFIRASIVDAATPVIFVQAADMGFTGKELPNDTQNKPEILENMEELRCICAEMIGLTSHRSNASKESPAVPKVAIVAPPSNYTNSSGVEINSEDVDLLARTKALAVMHKAYAITGGICLAAAALISGTVVNQVVSKRAIDTGAVRLGHPAGILEFDMEIATSSGGDLYLHKAAVVRTARRIMDGYVYVPFKIYWGEINKTTK